MDNGSEVVQTTALVRRLPRGELPAGGLPNKSDVQTDQRDAKNSMNWLFIVLGFVAVAILMALFSM